MNLPIKFSINGPHGWLSEKDEILDTVDLVSGKPLGLDHAYYEKENPILKVGIWRSSPYTEYFEDYQYDEFMYLLEGSVTVESENSKETFCKGDAFLLPKGFKGYWRQEEPVVKYYVLVDL